MGAALVLLLVALGAIAAGVLIGRYYVPDDRQLRRTARHSRAYMRALSHLVARDYDTVMTELRSVVEENIDDVEPYFALGAIFRSRGEHERAIRVHQALALRERDRRKMRQRAMYELGLDFRAAGMPRRATRAMEKVLLEEPGHEGALRALASLYEEQARFNESAGLWQRLGRRRGEDMSHREHHLLVAAAQAALGRDDADSAKQLLKAAQKLEESAHFYAAAAELAAARGNHRGARERLTQALVADPALAPHLLPGLVAAEQGLAAEERADHNAGRDRARDDDLAEEPAEPAEAQLPAAARAALPAAPPSTGRVTATGLPASADAAAATSSSPRRATPTALPAITATTAGAGTAPTAQSPSTTGETLSAVRDASAAGPDRAPAGGSPAAAGGSPGAASGTAAAAGGSTASGSAAMAGGSAATSANGDAAASVAGALVIASRGALAGSDAGDEPAEERPVEGIPLVAERPQASIAERVLAVLAAIEAQSGPRLELALIRAQLLPPADAAGHAALAADLVARFPEALAARVAAARLAIARGDDAAIRGALEGLVADDGALAWTLRGRWQCAHCGNRPGPFRWRCAQCRRWGSLRMETGIEPPPVAPRDRRAAPRARSGGPSGGPIEGLLGVPPDQGLPSATLDAGLTDAELASAGTRRSLLGRVGGWFSGVWRRDAS